MKLIKNIICIASLATCMTLLGCETSSTTNTQPTESETQTTGDGSENKSDTGSESKEETQEEAGSEAKTE